MKLSTQDLAIFGGEPAFVEKHHVGRPNIGDRDRLMERLNDLLDRRWLSNNGPYVQQFEKAVADYVGVKHCVAMCNGTIALEIAIRAADLTGEVIIPSMTFIATAHALQWQEITPVFCDIDPKTYNLDPGRIEALITPRTTGIVGVHLWGRPCNADALQKIAKKHNLKLLFDAAHAFGCTYQGQMIGGFGDAEIFSFHATKFCNALEGGAVVTNNDDLAKKMRLMKNFGFSGVDQVTHVGTNGKMNEMSAAMGLTSIESVDEFVEINRRNYKIYQEELTNVRGVKLMQFDDQEQSNYQYIIVEINDDLTQVSRDHFVRILWDENVMARRYFYPGCHRMEPYNAYFPQSYLWLPVTEQLSQRVMALPTGTAIDESSIRRICQIIRFIVDNGWDVNYMYEAAEQAGEIVVGVLRNF
ncbi:MAG: aminotransferase class I/II-fold pyridoxal phosphate-dependent enzyme [Chloroflexota bacterium]